MRLGRVAIAVAMVLCALGAAAQNITGKVVDSQGAPLTCANVVVLALPDSAYCDGAVTSSDGTFSIAAATPLPAVVRVSFIGFMPQEIVATTHNVGTITLNLNTTALKEVVVKGALPKTVLKGNTMITKVKGTILETSGKVCDLLKSVPGLQWADKKVSVLGRGDAEVYVNGRKLRDLTELENLSSDLVKDVEVITVPGAQYAAHVKAVVKINTVRSMGEGFGFNDEVSYVLHNKSTFKNDLNLSYRKEKLELMGQWWIEQAQASNDSHVEQITKAANEWKQVSDNHQHYKNLHWLGALQFNYTLSKHHSFGARTQYYCKNNGKQGLDFFTDIYRDDVLQETSKAWPSITATYHESISNAYYTGRAGKTSVDLNADLFVSTTKEDNVTPETSQEESREVHTRTDASVKFGDVRLSLGNSLWGGNVGYGVEYYFMKRNNEYENLEHIVSDDFSKYVENDVAAFVQYSHAIGKVHLTGGLRYEYSKTRYYQRGMLIEDQSPRYSDLFPSASVSWATGSVNWSLAYASRIARPGIGQLSGTVVYINKYTIQGGNPKLRPYRSQDVNLNMIYRFLVLSLNYQHIKDETILNSSPLSQENPVVSLLMPINTKPYNAFTASAVLQPRFGCYQPQLTLWMRWQDFKASTPEGERTFNHPLAAISLNNIVTLPYRWRIDASLNFVSRGHTQNIHCTRYRRYINIAVLKQLLNNSLELRASVNNLLANGQKVTLYNGNRTLMQTDDPVTTFSVSAKYIINPSRSRYKGRSAATGRLK
ncbi:MAG: TonB-dependent receptor [Muribaculaceae bacterium]|nr:TonB-dependent receptor [Muribaculaceae bacterium]